MNSHEISLAVITLSLNDPEATRATLKSVNSQTFRSISKIIIDSSKPPLREQVRKYCVEEGAYYHWVPAHGIYFAMREGLRRVQWQTTCMYLNSGDFFSSPDSVEQLAGGLANSDGSSAAWAIGGLSIHKDGEEIAQYFLPRDRKTFEQKLKRGEIYLPHPSTLYRTQQLREVDAFTDRLKIAADFATGLRMCKTFGPPAIVHDLISVFSVGGASSQHPIRIHFENMVALASVFGWRVLPVQLVRAIKETSLHLLRKARGAS